MGERRRRRPSGGSGSLLQLLIVIAIVAMCSAATVGPLRKVLGTAHDLSACQAEVDAAFGQLESGGRPSPTPSCPNLWPTRPAAPPDPAPAGDT